MPRVPDPVLPRDLSSCSEVPRRSTEGLFWLEPTPFTLGRFRTAPSGICFSSSTSDLNPPPLLSSGFSSPRSFTSTLQPHPHARVSAPLMRFRPLQRSTESGVRIPGGSNHRHRSSSGFLTLLTTCSAQNHAGLVSSPLRSWGSLGPRHLARTFRSDRGDAPKSPLHGVLFSHDEHVLACSPVLRFAASSCCTLSGHNQNRRRTLHGLTRRRIGVSQGSEPRAPTILRFSADHTLVNSKRLLSPWVSPQRSASVAARLPASTEPSASPPFTASRACV